MTDLLKKAFDAARTLSPRKQDALAKMLLGKIESDEQWSSSFEASRERLESLADEALEEHAEGRTEPLDPDEL